MSFMLSVNEKEWQRGRRL